METFVLFIEARIVSGHGWSNVNWYRPLVLERSAGLNGVKTLEIVGPDCDCFEDGSTIPRSHYSPMSLVRATNRGSS